VIYEMAQDIRAALLARGYPIELTYGPEAAVREDYHGSLIIIERDRESSDAFAPPKGARENAPKRGVRVLAAKATIYAKSSLEGAHVGDHERLCEMLIDALQSAIYNWGVEGRTGGITIASGKYLPASARNLPETWPGVVYELKFGVPRGVSDLRYPTAGEGASGEARPTGSAAGFRNRTEARLTGAGDDDPALGCGSDE
jgi:hypothetical protein